MMMQEAELVFERHERFPKDAVELELEVQAKALDEDESYQNWLSGLDEISRIMLDEENVVAYGIGTVTITERDLMYMDIMAEKQRRRPWKR